jgi:hypothetical protein
MKKILAVVMVLGIAAVVANAGIAVTWSKTGTYTVASSTGTFTVDQYKITASTDDGSKITAFSTYGKGPLVQATKWEVGEDEEWGTSDDVYTPTPTMNNQLSTNRDADTHFLFSDDQLINATAPAETNDMSKGYTGVSTRRAWGLGTNTLVDPNDPNSKYSHVSYRSDSALVLAVAAPSVTWFQFDIIAGTYANTDWCVYGGATNGVIAKDFYIPEPATLSLIGLGGLALLRRRKR